MVSKSCVLISFPDQLLVYSLCKTTKMGLNDELACKSNI